MKPIDVFISRKSADAPYAGKIYDYLATQGLTVFESDQSLRELGNADYIKAIDEALVSATHMIVVGSSAANIKSSWVEAEWLFFLNRKRSGKTSGNLFTVITKGMELADVPPSLANYEVIPYNEKNFPIIYNYVRQPNTPAKPAPKNPFPAGTQNKLLWVALGIVLVGILLFVVYLRSQPFDLTVFAKPSPTLRLSPQYPAFSGGELSVFIDNKEEKRQLLANGEGVFKQIPASFLGRKVAVELQSDYWKPAQDSVVLAKTFTIPLIPDGSLGTITGNVKTQSGMDLGGFKIKIDNDTTIPADNQGGFTVVLPYSFQKKEYRLTAQKPGYKQFSDYYLPISGTIDLPVKK